MSSIFFSGYFLYDWFIDSSDSSLVPAIYQDINCPDDTEVETVSFTKLPNPAISLICEGNATYAIPEQLIVAVGQGGWVIRRTECGHAMNEIDSGQLDVFLRKISSLKIEAFSNEGDTIGKTCVIQVNLDRKSFRVLFNENWSNKFRYTESERGKKWLKALEILDSIPIQNERNILIKEYPTSGPFADIKKR